MAQQEVGMSVDAFRNQLRKEVEEICKSNGKSYDNNQARGFAFQVWVADLLMRIHAIDEIGEECVFTTNDLKIDIAFDEEETKTLCLSQTKHESGDIQESEVNDFFSRHSILLNQRQWVREHASEDLNDLIADYAQRVAEGWNINFYFISTGRASDRTKKLATDLDIEIKKKHPNVNFVLYDLYSLKEQFIRSKSLEQAITETVEIQFGRGNFIEKDHPHRTIVAIVKGNTIVNLYRKEREALFAYNIRSFLGKRVNNPIVETADKDPSEFFYFNNGIAAICTRMDELGRDTFRFENFQIINGAQTVGSLAAVGSLSSDCEVILRVTQGASVKTEKGFNADIIKYNNTQNVVRASDFRSNDKIQLWLEEEFNQVKARGAIARPVRYVRKRSFRRVREADVIRLEELAKIRFAFNHEPTRCIADPRSLWTHEEDGGFYEQAFGLNGKLEDSWDSAEFRKTLFAAVTFQKIMQRIAELTKQDKASYHFLRRLRYWAVTLAALSIDHYKLDTEKLLGSAAEFDGWFKKFWADIFRDLVNAHQAAQVDKISNFALARNETRWNQTRQTVLLVLKANL